MKFLAIISGVTALLALIAVTGIAMIDIPVEQKVITKTVPNDTFFNNNGSQ